MEVQKYISFGNNYCLRNFLFSSTVLIAIILPFTAGQFAEAEEVAEYKSETSDSAFDDRERRGRPFHFTILYIIVATYAFVGLILTCKYFFVPSLDVIVEKFGIHDDVAGATFMAIGLSMNALLVSCLGVFISADDISPLESVTGTSLFNIFLVVGLCAVIGKSFAPLTCWPLIRDSVFFLIGLAGLYLVCLDHIIHWYEFLFLGGIFVAYILLMKCDDRLRLLTHKFCGNQERVEDGTPSNSTTCIVPDEGTILTEHPPEHEVKSQGLTLAWPEGSRFLHVAHLIFFPITILLYCTLPDVSTPRGRRFCTWAFGGSIIWTIILSDVILWIAQDNPDDGIQTTFNTPWFLLVAGIASSPILIASLILARRGKGAMILHAGLGSVIFDICVRTTLPAFISAIFFSQSVRIQVKGAACQVGILCVMSCLFISTLACFRCKLSKAFGILVLIYYFLFTSVVILFEYEFFTCPM